MYHMAQRGWLCVAINYRLSPQAAFPAHIIDVKKAIAWIRENIAEYGGNPDFIAITGGSAGGHLSSLAALTPNRAEWQPGFEDADTTLQAAVPFYGVYDFLDRYDIRPEMSMEEMIAERVMQCTRRKTPSCGIPARRSAMSRRCAAHVCDPGHPRFPGVGGGGAGLCIGPAGGVQQPVAYAELPGAQHAFEIFHSVRTDHTVHAVGHFLEWTTPMAASSGASCRYRTGQVDASGSAGCHIAPAACSMAMAASGAVSVRRTRGPSAGTGNPPAPQRRFRHRSGRPPARPARRRWRALRWPASASARWCSTNLRSASLLPASLQSLQGMNQRQAIAATLLAGADGDLLPVLQFFFGPVAAQLDLGAFGEQGCHRADTQLGGFLHHPVHAIAA